MRAVRVVISFCAIVMALISGSAPTVQASNRANPFVLGASGCAMAHCTSTMSDQVGLPAPAAGAAVLWQDPRGAGSGPGLGCTSNATVVACTYRDGASAAVVAYAANGQRLWDSETLLDGSANHPVVLDQQHSQSAIPRTTGRSAVKIMVVPT